MPETKHTLAKHLLFALCFIAAIVLADQYSKWLVMETLLRTKGDGVDFHTWMVTSLPPEHLTASRENFRALALTPFLNFVMVWNQGISFGMFDSGGGQSVLILTVLSVVIALGLFGWLVVARHWFTSVVLSCIIGGAIGNVLDRLRFGAVADFIDLHLQGRHWPAFNIADSFIVVGALLLMLHTLFSKSDRPETGE